ncbi:MAG: VanZ family protein, partial [Candidatus Aminicenantaceae bacterium]
DELRERRSMKSNWRNFWTAKLIKNHYFYSLSLTAVVGTADEIYQYFLPRRSFRLYDVFLNLLGGILGLLVFWGYQTLKKEPEEKSLLK